MQTSSAVPNISLRRQAVMATALLVGCYVLALAAAGVLFGVVVTRLASPHPSLTLALAAALVALAILAGILPPPDRFEPPWPRLRREDQPELFQRLDTVARAAGQELPGEVYLVPQLSVWVADRGGVLGIGTRRVLGVGLPLLHVLDVAQLGAVLAHEYGHDGRDVTALGPRMMRTRGALVRALRSVGESAWSPLRLPFGWCARMYLRATRAVAREQEFAADRVAAEIAGPQALAGALRRQRGYAPRIRDYWDTLVLPALGAGYRPPICAGLDLMLAAPEVARAAEAHADECLDDEAADPFDAHPALRERLAALEGIACAVVPDTTRAVTLLREAGELERLLLGSMLQPDALFRLKEIPWSEVGERVFLRNWHAWRARNRNALGSWTVARMPEVLDNAGVIAGELVDVDGTAPAPGERTDYILDALTSCLAMALVDAGWEFAADPCGGVRFLRDGRTADPADLVFALATGEIGAGRWVEICVELGLRDALLAGPGVAAPAPPAAIAGAAPGRRFATYRVPVEEFGAPLELVTFLPPDDAYRIGGLPPETVVGKLLTPGAELSSTNFVRNPAFVDFLHAVVARAVPDIAEYRAMAREIGDGWLDVHDLRAHGRDSAAAARDVMGRVRVANGEIVAGSYEVNREHRIVNEDGMFAPHPAIQERILAALRELRHDPAAARKRL